LILKLYLGRPSLEALRWTGRLFSLFEGGFFRSSSTVRVPLSRRSPPRTANPLFHCLVLFKPFGLDFRIAGQLFIFSLCSFSFLRDGRLSPLHISRSLLPLELRPASPYLEWGGTCLFRNTVINLSPAGPLIFLELPSVFCQLDVP